MTEERHNSVFREAGVRVDETVNDYYSRRVDQKKKLKARNMGSMKEKDKDPYHKQVTLHGEITETVKAVYPDRIRSIRRTAGD